MTTAAHTPGPWDLHGEYMTRYVYARGEKISGVVAVVNLAWPHKEQQDEQLANACLIACAPDLLAALETLVPMFAEWHSEFPEHVGDKEAPALQLARAAIAKATGAA